MDDLEFYDEIYDDLMVRLLAGEASDEEEALLLSRMKDSEELARRFNVMKNVWEQAEDPEVYSGRDVSVELNSVRTRIRRLKTRRMLSVASRWFQKAAAVIVLPLIAVVFMLYKGHASATDRYVPVAQEITTLPGTRLHTFLPDSTEIWLNGGSSLFYSQDHSDGRRMVDIAGEAYFKVAHDEKHPFVVRSEDIAVWATGTEFNVCSYATDSLSTVTLTEGTVRVEDGVAETAMSPGETIVYNRRSRNGVLYLGNTDKITSWRHGRLVFKNETLSNVYKRLGQIYGLTFVVDSGLRDVLFYATFEDASLEQIMQLIKKSTALEYSSIEYNGEAASGSSTSICVKPAS